MSSIAIPAQTTYDEKRKIWHGLRQESAFGPECSLGAVALQTMLKNPNHINQICYNNGKIYTNREIATLSIRVALHFKRMGVEQGQVIGLCASNSDFLAPLFFGALLSGLTVSTLDPTFNKDDMKHIFGITKPSILFCDGLVYNSIKKANEENKLEIPIYTMKDHIEGVLEINEFLQPIEGENYFKPEPLKYGGEQTAAILCSSGTTGLPKGVCMSHAALLNLRIFQNMDQERFLCFSTLYWVSGLICILGGTIENATRIISDRPFCAEDYLDAIEKYKVTALFSPPSQIAMSIAHAHINDANLSSVTTYFCGGAAVSYEIVAKMQQYMTNARFIIGYGMSEVNGAIAYATCSSNGSTGQIMNNVEIKIIDEAGNSLGPKEPGEICIRTPYKWAGYYGNPEATAATYDENGWIYSGDIGYVDDGDIYIIDRKKDIFKYKNYQFFPTEIENVIQRLEDVTEVCVCGIPDVVATHLPAAAIVSKPGSKLTEEEVAKYVAENMSFYKHLWGGVYFLNEIPKTVSGKNLRRKVTNICEALRNAQKPVNDNEDILKAGNVIRVGK